MHPAGFQNLREFRLDPFPVFTYSNPHFTLTKSVFMVRGENTVVVEYSLAVRGDAKDISLEVRPLIAFRDYHATTHENSALDGCLFEMPGCVRLKPYSDLPSLFLAHDADVVVKEGHWYRNFEYQEEKARGLDYSEDLFSPLTFKASLNSRTRFLLIASTERRSTLAAAGYRRAEIRVTNSRIISIAASMGAQS